uniref:HMG box domain-containing protein n=1 Tax=Romanomermis culicivorax TaxID=13658 RepID=A0A915J7T0_ROMCU
MNTWYNLQWTIRDHGAIWLKDTPEERDHYGGFLRYFTNDASNDASQNRISTDSSVRRLIARPSSSSSNIILCPINSSMQVNNFSVPSKDRSRDASVVQLDETTNFLRNDFLHKNGKAKRKSILNNVKRKLNKNSNLPFQLPQPPLTAYTLFCKSRRSIIKLENSDAPLSEIMKILGKEWSTLSKPNKQTFIDMANEELSRYKRELAHLKCTSDYKKHMKQLKADKKNVAHGESPQNGFKNAEEDLLNEFFEKPTALLAGVEGAQDKNEATCSNSLFSILDEELYCQDCKVYFTNLHNKNQHEISKRHWCNLKKKITNIPRSSNFSQVDVRNRTLFYNHENWAGDFILNCYAKNQECELELKVLEDRFEYLTSRNRQLNLLIDHFAYEKQCREMQLKLLTESNATLQSRLLHITSIMRLLSDEEEEKVEVQNAPNGPGNYDREKIY